jgi:hypothetical protein
LPRKGDNGANNGKPKHLQKVVQPHGGALNGGGTPGNKGGGSQPAAVRRKLREIGERGLPVLEGIVQGRTPVRMVGACQKCGHEHEDYDLLPTDILLIAPKPSDRAKAIDIALRHGLDGKGLDEELVQEMSAVVALVLDGEQAKLEEILAGWKPILAKRLRS